MADADRLGGADPVADYNGSSDLEPSDLENFGNGSSSDESDKDEYYMCAVNGTGAIANP
jgi:hypothetical protein